MLTLHLLLASSRPTVPDALVFGAAALVILIGSVGVVTVLEPGARRPLPCDDALRGGRPLH